MLFIIYQRETLDVSFCCSTKFLSDSSELLQLIRLKNETKTKVLLPTISKLQGERERSVGVDGQPGLGRILPHLLTCILSPPYSTW